ncbi:MAG: hypothetical protein A6F71_09920 [Cycloclasticus sp. symbiont of Poecilosclerida sp. M]|nr:MAG: hypothetical protein A6F71_09920 [Cycloclasticus sp. symbiont of Poecilosclerida sp. M]
MWKSSSIGPEDIDDSENNGSSEKVLSDTLSESTSETAPGAKEKVDELMGEFWPVEDSSEPFACTKHELLVTMSYKNKLELLCELLLQPFLT